MTGYTVDIAIGAHTWTVERTDGERLDGVAVLDGLRIGWASPVGLGPSQPEAMVAALVLNVPEFLDAADIDQGTTVAIEFRFDPDAEEPFAAFYGRISDAVAQPRRRRTGVLISLVAVDYTVDPVDLPDWSYGAHLAARGYSEVLTTLWADNPTLGALPDWPGGDPNGPTVTTADGYGGVVDVIKSVLVCAVDADSLARVIVAPLIASDGGLDTQHYAFDKIHKHPTSTWTLPAGVRRESIRWRRSRRRVANTLEVTGADGLRTLVFWPDVGAKSITERLGTICADVDELDAIAAFYLPDPEALSSWTLDQFVIELQTLDDTQLAELPGDLFPRWYRPEGNAGRSSCYEKRVSVPGWPADLNPYEGAPTLAGLLDAVTLVVSGGHVTLETRLRQLGPDTHTPGRLVLGGYALGGYGGYGIAP